ncbi:putative epoxide hydrolase [Fusarium oxysporum f. sp. albedinis]|nr:putative epoxide hydrolase [Fusarium oxysporum f. sp. albedinis]
MLDIRVMIAVACFLIKHLRVSDQRTKSLTHQSAGLFLHASSSVPLGNYHDTALETIAIEQTLITIVYLLL